MSNAPNPNNNLPPPGNNPALPPPNNNNNNNNAGGGGAPQHQHQQRAPVRKSRIVKVIEWFIVMLVLFYRFLGFFSVSALVHWCIWNNGHNVVVIMFRINCVDCVCVCVFFCLSIRGFIFPLCPRLCMSANPSTYLCACMEASPFVFNLFLYLHLN